MSAENDRYDKIRLGFNMAVGLARFLQALKAPVIDQQSMAGVRAALCLDNNDVIDGFNAGTDFAVAIHSARGTVPAPDELSKMTVTDLVCKRLIPNHITFMFDKPLSTGS